MPADAVQLKQQHVQVAAAARRRLAALGEAEDGAGLGIGGRHDNAHRPPVALPGLGEAGLDAIQALR